jgi:ketosteroid isomerase-like protein
MSESVDIVLAAISAVEQRDAKRLLDLYHQDIEFRDAPSLPYGGVVRGKAAVEEHMYGPCGWIATWVPLQPTPTERAMNPRVVASNDEVVVVEYRQRAIGPDGERFDGPVLGLYRVRDAKLAASQMFHYDTAAVVSFLHRAHAGEQGSAE